MIGKIARWLQKYSASKDDVHGMSKVIENYRRQLRLIIFLKKLRLARVSKMIVDNWLAIDIYPEYEKDVENVIGFILEMSMQNFQ